MSQEITLLSRGIVRLEDGKILLCRVKGGDWHFLPGGHVEFGEGAEATLAREFKEETGRDDLRIGALVGVAEVAYTDKEGAHQEINMIFESTLHGQTPQSQEDHIEFNAFTAEEIQTINLLPAPVKDYIKNPKGFLWVPLT